MFPFYQQLETKDCGPTCIKIIAKYYDKTISIETLRKLSETTRQGSNLKSLAEAAEFIGFRTLPVKINLNQLKEIPLPSVLHWNQEHFIVLYKIKKDRFFVSDPAQGKITYQQKEFIEHWISDGNNGIALLLEPTPNFFNEEDENNNSKLNLSFIYKYLIKYKRFFWQIGFGLLAGSIIQLIFPFLTQSIVDVGIRNLDIHFVYLVLIAQLLLFVGKTSVEIIRSWIILHLSTRVNISLVSDFFIKLMQLPMAYFDTRLTGDILLRIQDHERIEKLLTSSSLNILFSMINLLAFGLVLMYYNFWIFSIFMFGSFLYFGWIIMFLKKRRLIDYKYFIQSSKEQSKVIELINGMQDIKLHKAEKEYRWDWEHIQTKLFKISVSRLTLDNYQNVGSGFINELKNIIITILAAKLVIDGDITLGMMLAISYIVGQLNGPITQIIDFLRDFQDAKISLERLSEIHNKQNEFKSDIMIKTNLPNNANIMLDNISFRYKGAEDFVLHNISMTIPKNKVTAIVGSSGSGKTTLLKLLLKYYEPQHGKIFLGDKELSHIPYDRWRSSCGVVMQEGFIFTNTITRNITMSEDVDLKRLQKASEKANINQFIESLPLSYNTIIGSEGLGLSTGQKQRILIARAIYNTPDYLFFDEATSALDANNEKIIMKNLQEVFKDKTVFIIAHRLSTVKNAHQIVVLENGKIVEIGNHEKLVEKKGAYYKLIKNQLELGV